MARTPKKATVVKTTPMRKQLELLRETNKALDELVNELMADKVQLDKELNNLRFAVKNLEHQAIGYRAVVSFLENKLGNDTV